MQVGAKLPLNMQLFDCAEDQFIRVWVRNVDGDEITGSPVDLTHVALGLYSDTTLEFPSGTPWVSAQYVVYSDSGYTTISPSEGANLDQFFKDPPSSSGGGSAVGSAIIGILESEIVPPVNGIQDVIVKGSDRQLSFRLVVNEQGAPYDLTSTTAITVRMLNADRTVLEISSDDAGDPIVITKAEAGEFTCDITAEQTALLMAQTPAAFTVALDTSAGVLLCNLPYQLAVEDPSVP